MLIIAYCLQFITDLTSVQCITYYTLDETSVQVIVVNVCLLLLLLLCTVLLLLPYYSIVAVTVAYCYCCKFTVVNFTVVYRTVATVSVVYCTIA